MPVERRRDSPRGDPMAWYDAPGTEGEAILRRWARLVAVVLGLLLLVSAPALAQDDDEETEPGEFGRKGLYVALLAGYGYQMNGFVEQYDVGVATSSNGSPQIGGRVGYRILPPLAVELQLDYLTGASTNVTLLANSSPAPLPPGAVFGRFDVDALSFTPNIRIYMLPGRVQPYGVLGIGLFWSSLDDVQPAALGFFADRSETTFLLRAGGGLALQITDEIAVELGAEYIRPSAQNAPFRNVSFTGALLYKF